jgi:hypothetical protein
MNRVSCPSLKNWRFHGVFASLVAALAILFLPGSVRADAVITDPSQLSVSTLTNGGLISILTNVTLTVSNVVIATNTQIDATGFNATFSGGNLARIFTIKSGITLTLTNVTLTGGRNPQGAAIYVNTNGVLMCSNVVFNANNATNRAGAGGTAGSGGHIAGGAGANGAAGLGGAIYNNQGILFLNYCLFTNNLAAGGNGGKGGDGYNGLGGAGGAGGAGGPAYGGAIYNNLGHATITGSFFANNNSLAGSGGLGGNGGSGSIPGPTGAGGNGSISEGGAIYNTARTIVNLTNSSFIGNGAYGGNTAPQSVTYNGLSSNGQNGGSAYGGAVATLGTNNMENCTIYLNSCQGGTGGDTLGSATAGAGGNVGGAGIANSGIFLSRNCTIATNNAFAGTNGVCQVNTNFNGTKGLVVGGNLYRSGTGTSSTLINTILQHGAGPDAAGTIVDGGFNISSDTSITFTAGKGSVANTNAMLTNIVYFFTNQTFTCAPVLEIIPGSIAQDFVNTNTAPVRDERGAYRTNSTPDAGAFEVDPTAPIITQQPKDQAAAFGKSATFHVGEIGARPLTNQWFFIQHNTSITNQVGSNSINLTIANISDSDLGSYFVRVSNSLGSATSSIAILTNVSKLGIATNPVSQTNIGLGSTVTFDVVTTGAAPNYQWYFNTKPLPGTLTNVSGWDTPILTITDVVSNNAGSYYVKVTNSLSSTNSKIALLTIKDPGITNQPTSFVETPEHRPVSFSVGVSSSVTNILYIWRKVRGTTSDVVYTNSTTNVFTIANPLTNDSGTYFVVATNSRGSVTSNRFTNQVDQAESTINGTVTMGGIGVSNVLITNTIGANFKTAGHGEFQVGNLASNTYTFTPDQSIYTIVPASISVTVNGSPTTTNIFFQATPRGSMVSGVVRMGTNGINNILIANSFTNPIATANGGTFSSGYLPAGTYTFTPDPTYVAVTNVPPGISVTLDGTTNTSTNIIFRVFPTIHLGTVTNRDNIPFVIGGGANQSLRVQSSFFLTNDWINVADVMTGASNTATLTITNASSAPRFFLRVTTP